MKVKIEKIMDVPFPKKATDGAAAYDVYAAQNELILHGRQVITLGFGMEIPEGYEAKIEPRSGYSSKGFAGFEDMTFKKEHRYDCDVLVGKIDSDYRGVVGVIVNNRDKDFFIRKGQRIAQMTFYKVENAEFEIGQLNETQRGLGGFGHTNI